MGSPSGSQAGPERRSAGDDVDYRALQTGDDAAFAALIERHSATLRAFCRRFARDVDDLDDLIQESWICIWEHRLQYGQRGSFIGWATRIARTVCRQAGMQQASIRRGVDDGIEAPPPSDEARTRWQDEIEDAMLSAVLALPWRRRQAVVLRLCAGHSTDQTAKVLGCSAGTVKAALHQAKQDLRGRRFPAYETL